MRHAVRSEDYWEFRPEQRVHTIDGFLGTVIAVHDGPFPGSEEYQVVLDRGLGGGAYTASQLTAAPTVTAGAGTAAEDYPELAEVLVDRPDPARQTVYASKTARGDSDQPSDSDDDQDDDEGDDDDISDKDSSDGEEDGDGDGEDDGDAPPWAKTANVNEPGHDHTGPDEHGFRWPLHHDEFGEEDIDGSSSPYCTHCDEWHWPEDGHDPEVQKRLDQDEPRNYSHDYSRFCGPACQDGYEADLARGVGTHHIFHVEEPRDDEPHSMFVDPHSENPYSEPVGRRDSNYERRDPSAEGRCHYCRSKLPYMDRVRAHQSPGHGEDRQVTDPASVLRSSQPARFPEIEDPRNNPMHPSRLSSLIITAALDPDFRFHITAAWSDVVKKAKRIRSEGGVRVTMATDGIIVGEVKGDHNVYETGLQRLPGKTAAQSWSCGCKWGAYHWGADDDFSRFAGRMCSHALALQYEAQSRGMFGRNIEVDEHKPAWVPRKVVVKYDIDADKHLKGRSSSLKSADPVSAEPPLRLLVSALVAAGDDPAEIALALTASGVHPGQSELFDASPYRVERSPDPLVNPENAEHHQRWKKKFGEESDPNDPERGDYANPHEWYHGSSHQVAEFRNEDERGSDGANSEHWNNALGTHWAVSHELAEIFGPHIHHAELHITKPKHYESEFGMDREVYSHEYDAGNTPDKHDPTYHQRWSGDPHLGHNDDLRQQGPTITHPETGKEVPNSEGRYMRWLSTHPDRAGMADRFKQRLKDQGHDGIIYGNEIERNLFDPMDKKNLCAVPFDSGKIRLTQSHPKKNEDGENSPCLPRYKRNHHTAAVNSPWGEPSPSDQVQMPRAPGSTSPPKAWVNPASAGPLAAPDPVGWNLQIPPDSLGERLGTAAEAALFEPDGTEAMLNDEPEGALPSTDGDHMSLAGDVGAVIPSNLEAMTPWTTAMRKRAVKDFTSQEQAALINEGEGAEASNLDRLQIEGTHYAELERALAEQRDDLSWLA